MGVKNKLLEIRLQQGFKYQKDFAEYLKISRPQYSKYENNIEQPSIDVLYKIAQKLNLKIDDIVYEPDK